MGPFAATFFISLFVLLMQFLWKYIDDLVGKGLEWYVLSELLFYASSTFVPLALPLAMLLSSIMTFGNLGEHSELTAIKAAGVSLQKAMRPLIATAFSISILAFLFSNYVLPLANLKMGTLLYDVRSQKPALNLKEGIFNSEIDGYVLYVGKKERDGETVRKVIIIDHTYHSGRLNITLAENGRINMSDDRRYMIFSLSDGYNYNESHASREERERYPFKRTKFDKQQILFDLNEFALSRSNEEIFRDNFQMMNVSQLTLAIDSFVIDFANKKVTQANRLFAKTNWLKLYSDGDSLIYATAADISPDTCFISNNNPDKYHIIYEAAINYLRDDAEYMAFVKEDFKTRSKLLNKHRIEYQRKFTLSVACLILFFVGAPLGAIIRKGGFGMPMVLSVLLFIGFHVLSITGEKMVREGAIPASQGMWIATAVFLPVGLFMTMKATTDAKIFSIDYYKGMISGAFRLLFHIKKNTGEDSAAL